MSDAHVLLDIRGENRSALAAIASTKAAMHGLGDEQRRFVASSKQVALQSRDIQRSLDRQRRSLKSLTLDYVALKRAIFTLGIRAAITGFAALSGVVTSLGADVVKLTSEVTTLGGAIGALGSSAIAGGIQAWASWKLALDGVGKALTTTGHQHELAMQKLTKRGRQLVQELEPLRKAYVELKLVAQEGMAPGLESAAKRTSKLIDTVRDSVWNTSQAMGYLADKGMARLVKREGELKRILRENTVTIRRGGEAAIELGDSWIAASDAARPAVRHMTDDIVKWSVGVRRSIRQAKRDGSLASFFDDGLRAWKVWTSTVGHTGGAVGAVLKASASSAQRMADNINKAARAAEDWAKGDANQRKMRAGFRELEPLTGEIAKTLGAVFTGLVTIGVAGADSATQILHGFRTEILPLVEEMAISLNDNMVPAIIDMAREMTEFIKNASPGLKFISRMTGNFVGFLADGLDIINQIVERMPAFNQGVAGLIIGAGILIGWSKFKSLLELSLLSLRQIVGLAPKVRAANSITPHAAGGVTAGVPGGSGRPARKSGGAYGPVGFTSVGGSQYRNRPVGPGQNNIIRPISSPLSSRPPMTLMPTIDRHGNASYAAGPYGATLTRPGGRAPLTRLINGPGGPQFVPLDARLGRRNGFTTSSGVIPPLSPMQRVRRENLPGGSHPGSAIRRTGSNAGYGSFITQVSKNTATGAYTGVKNGIERGAKAAAPALKTFAKFGIGAGVISGIMGALAPGELKGAGNRINRFMSGFTFGAIQTNDSRAANFTNDALNALQDKGKLRLDARSDEQRELIGKFGKSTLNLAKQRDIDRLKEWVKVSEKVNKISRDEARSLLQAAEGFGKLANHVDQVRQAQRRLGGKGENPFFDPNEVQRGLGVLQTIFSDFKNQYEPGIGDARKFVKRAMHSIKRDMVEGSESAKNATSLAFNQAASAIKKGLRDGTINAKKGAAELRRIFRKDLALYGITGTAATHYLDSKYGDTAGKDHGAGSQSTYAGGGYVGRKGQRGRDDVPALLNGQPSVVARGEYVGVMTGEQQQAFDTMARRSGYGGMHGFFERHKKPHSRSEVKHYAQGGMVPIPGEPGESISKRILPSVVALDRRYRLDITDGYAPTGHAAGGEHPLGLAIDAVPDFGNGGSWDLIDKLNAWAQTKLGTIFRWIGYDGVPGHGRGNHIHLSWLANAMGLGKMGGNLKRIKADKSLPLPVQGLVQGGLDGVLRGAKAKLNSAINATGGTGTEAGEGGSVSGSGAGLMRQISRERGWNFADWWALDASESSHGTNLSNPTSSARLRGQFLDFNYGKYGPGSDPRQNPTMAQQIYSMARYIAERYGNPTKAWQFHQAHNWYAGGDEPSPPTSGGTAPPVNMDDGKTPSTDELKDPPKGPTPPYYAGNYPGGVSSAIEMSKRLLHRGRKGRIKPLKLRAKVRHLRKRLKDGKWKDDPTWVNPLTGEPIDVEQQPLFSRIEKLRDKYPGLVNKANNLADKNSLTDESATLGLEGDDLKRWLRANGSTPAQIEKFIATYGDGLEVANIHGFSVHGKYWGGLDQAGAEIGGEVNAHQLILANLQDQLEKAKKTHTKGPTERRRHRLRKIKRIFEGNREVIKHSKKKIDKAKKSQGWHEQVEDNNRIINALRRHKRDSADLPRSYRTRIDHDIDKLTDINTTLRLRKPKRAVLGMDKVMQVRDQRQRENNIIAGAPGVTTWAAAVGGGGGLAGVAATSLSNWKAMGSYRGDVMDEARTGITDEKSIIARLGKDLQDFKDAGWVAPPQAQDDDSGTTARDELLKQIGLDALRGARLGDFQGNALVQFANLLGMRSIGAFAHGAVDVKQTGLALLHRNETVMPDPDGAFRNGMTMNRLRGNDTPGDVYLVAEGDLGRLLSLIDMRVRRGSKQAATQQGASVRAIRAAPGR